MARGYATLSDTESSRAFVRTLRAVIDPGGQCVDATDRLYLAQLWGYTLVPGDRSVDVFVRKLRSKIERASPDWTYIHTHFGIGYRLDAQPLRVEGIEAGASGEEGRAAGSEGASPGLPAVERMADDAPRSLVPSR